MITDHRFAELAAHFGTPLYVYDGACLHERALRFYGDITHRPLRVHAALSANAHPDLLRICRAAGIGAFVSSAHHLALALDTVGWSPDQIIFASSNTPDYLIQRIAARGVIFHANSVRELTTYALCSDRRSEIGLRVAWPVLDSDAPSRLGLQPADLLAASEIACQYNLTVTGLHVYLGTQLADAAYYAVQVRALRPLINRFPMLEYVDLSGGFPVTGFDYAQFSAYLSPLLDGLALVIEPGRSLFAEAGTFLTRVTEVYHDGNHILVSVDGSASQLPLALFHRQVVQYPVVVVGRDAPAQPIPVTIGGVSTYSRDYLARNVYLPPLSPGDLLAFSQTGACGYADYTDFLGVSRPAEVMIDDVDGILPVGVHHITRSADVQIITPHEKIAV